MALALIFLARKLPKLSNLDAKISTLFAFLFLIGSSGLINISGATTLNLLPLPNGFSLAFLINSSKALLLLVLGIFWILTSIHSNRYFTILGDVRKSKFNILFLAIVTCLAGIILSKNLITTFLFYQLIALFLFLVANDFRGQQSNRSAKYFGIFILGTSSFFFLAMALSFKLSGQIEFMQGGIFLENTRSMWKLSLTLFFYLAAIGTIAFVPFYLLFNNLYFLPSPAIIAVLTSFGFVSAVLLSQVISEIFGIRLFANIVDKINQNHLLTIFLALNLISSAIWALLSKNLKQILTLLFFNQLIAILMAFLVIGLNAKKMELLILSFVLTQSLIFIVVGNINLYLKSVENKSLNGIFYKIRLTILALIFALFNLIGLTPAVGMAEKYWLFRDVINNGSALIGAILIVNLLICLACIAKMIYPMLEISKENYDEQSDSVGRVVEKDLRLITPIIIIPAILFSFAIPFVTNYFSY